MQSIIKITLIAVILVQAYSSCSDIYENIKEFSPQEAVYPAKFDTLGWRLGYERVEFYLNKGGKVPSDQMKLGKAKKTVIEYDDKHIVIDSVCSWVNISGLTEQRMYHFKIYTEDQYGNKSIPQETQLTPFTKIDLDVLSLVPPNVIESTSAAVVEWGSPIESDLYQFFSYSGEYTDKDGQVHAFEGGNLPSFIVENVLLDVEIPIKIRAKILPYIGGIPLLDTIPAWETYYNLRISEAAKPAIFLKTPEAASVINIFNTSFPIEFSWTKVPEVSDYVLKISKVRDFPVESTKVIDLGDAGSYLMTKEEAMDQIFTDFDPLTSSTAYYWQIEPKEQTASVRLQLRTVNYKHVEGELVQEDVETTDARCHYTGDNLYIWEPGVYHASDSYVVWQNNSVEVSFYGRYIAWYALYNNDLGNGRVYIDGELDADVVCWASYRRVEKLYEKFWPEDGNHTIKVVASPGVVGGNIVHDYFMFVHEVK
ncbi:MAG: DUF4998 domain-containing protein [Dysgonamonadaceae bacterium]|jgi:hypothetical protein|nr:DUF4998 domain-containing protein [Dysgonamonadaceae bacterium]